MPSIYFNVLLSLVPHRILDFHYYLKPRAFGLFLIVAERGRCWVLQYFDLPLINMCLDSLLHKKNPSNQIKKGQGKQTMRIAGALTPA